MPGTAAINISRPGDVGACLHQGYLLSFSGQRYRSLGPFVPPDDNNFFPNLGRSSQVIPEVHDVRPSRERSLGLLCPRGHNNGIGFFLFYQFRSYFGIQDDFNS